MSALVWILISTSLISLISLVGIITLSFKEKMMDRILMFLVALSAGALMGGAFLHLMPEAVAAYSEIEIDLMFLNVIMGFVVFFLLEKILYWHHCHDAECEEHTFGYMILVGDIMHNFIDGLVIAAAFVSNIQLGIATTLAIAFHEIPQELGDFGVLLHSGMKKRKAILMNFVTALAIIIGGLLGFSISSVASNFVQILLPIAAGGFIYIASSDLIPELRKIDDPKKSASTFAVFLFGILLMWIAKAVFV